MSVVASEGLIRNIARGTHDGVEGREKWVLTELGEELLSLLGRKKDDSDAFAEISVRVSGPSQ